MLFYFPRIVASFFSSPKRSLCELGLLLVALQEQGGIGAVKGDGKRVSFSDSFSSPFVLFFSVERSNSNSSWPRVHLPKLTFQAANVASFSGAFQTQPRLIILSGLTLKHKGVLLEAEFFRRILSKFLGLMDNCFIIVRR